MAQNVKLPMTTKHKHAPGSTSKCHEQKTTKQPMKTPTFASKCQLSAHVYAIADLIGSKWPPLSFPIQCIYMA
jgi:hypothetical protein